MDELEGTTRGKQVTGYKEASEKKEGRQKYQIIRFEILTPGEKKQIRTNTKQEHDKVTGVFINVDQQESLVGSLIDLNIDDTEIIPEGFEATLLNRVTGVSINNMPYDFNVRAKNSKITLNYSDGKAPNTTYPYFVSVYLRAIDE